MLKCSGKRTRKNFRLPCLNSSPRVMAGDLSLNKETQYVLHDRSVFCAPGSLHVLCPGIAPCSVPHDRLVFCAPRLLRVLCPEIILCSVPHDHSMFCAPRSLCVLCPEIASCSMPQDCSRVRVSRLQKGSSAYSYSRIFALFT